MYTITAFSQSKNLSRQSQVHTEIENFSLTYNVTSPHSNIFLHVQLFLCIRIYVYESVYEPVYLCYIYRAVSSSNYERLRVAECGSYLNEQLTRFDLNLRNNH